MISRKPSAARRGDDTRPRLRLRARLSCNTSAWSRTSPASSRSLHSAAVAIARPRETWSSFSSMGGMTSLGVVDASPLLAELAEEYPLPARRAHSAAALAERLDASTILTLDRRHLAE